MDGNTALVHRGAERIARRMSEILGEPITTDMVYGWRAAGKLNCHEIGGSIAISEARLLEDLSGKDAA
jgi:hypothetical protein